MRIILLIFLFSFSLYSQDKFPTIIDLINEKSDDFFATSKVSLEKEIIYIGKYKDSIYSKRIFNRITPIKNHYENPCDSGYIKRKKGSFKNAFKAKLKIQVDTSQVIKFEKWKSRSPKYYNAYPVSIKNIDNQVVNIGYWYYTPVILEAKDKNNQWKKVEKLFIPSCGTCMNQIYFPPNEIVITTAVIYKGNYKTKLRLKIGGNYSNEYEGNINYKQIK